MVAVFIWDEWNKQHAEQHGVRVPEIEQVVRDASNPFPRRINGDKWVVWGRSDAGRPVQVIFVIKPEDEVDPLSVDVADLMMDDANFVYVIHARPLTASERSSYRRM